MRYPSAAGTVSIAVVGALLFLLLVDGDIAFQGLNPGGRRGLVGIGEEICAAHLLEADFAHEPWGILVAGVFPKYVGGEGLSSVEILGFDLARARTGEHNFHIFVLLLRAVRLQYDNFLILLKIRRFG